MGAKKRKDKSEIGLKINAATSKFTIMMIINDTATLHSIWYTLPTLNYPLYTLQSSQPPAPAPYFI